MPALILIGGGSSSGKSYLTKAVIQNLGPDRVTSLTLDDYYKDQADVPLADRYLVNYDHPSSFDWPLMRKQLASLKNGETIEKPIYDFVTLTRSGKTEVVEPKDLILVEGIMALVDRRVRDLGDLLVFINASAERRFLRRMIRDTAERGRTFDNIIRQYFTTVQPMYDEIVKPSSMYADLIINNDGVENLAIDVLTCLFREELESASHGKVRKRKMEEEFPDDVLSRVFPVKKP